MDEVGRSNWGLESPQNPQAGKPALRAGAKEAEIEFSAAFRYELAKDFADGTGELESVP